MPGSGCTRLRPRCSTSPPTSRVSAASTICTRSRRFAGWTRSWSTISWCSPSWLNRSTIDLVIGDESWDVDHFLHENPELKRFRFAWLTDFVGWLPMPDADDRERLLTADLNAEMLEHRARFGPIRDRSIFVGNPGDVVPDPFGPGLPRIDSLGAGRTSTSPAISPVSPPRTRWIRRSVRARWGCGTGRTALPRHGRRLRRRRRSAAPGAGRGADHSAPVTGPAIPGGAGPRIDPGSLPEAPGDHGRLRARICTGTWPPATSPSCRAG